MSETKPNIIFIMSDDHAAHAMSCYGSRINKTPHLDRLADGGMRFDNCFCTNSICTPSRAAILTGTYNHVNGVTTLATPMDNGSQTFPKLLQESGYQTALYGKWHLGQGPKHCPTGFDDWAVLPGQGFYHNPTFIFKGPDGGERRTVQGYVTDIITDMCLDWLEKRDSKKPFCMLYQHKAPHRPWYPDEKHAGMFLNEDVPEPAGVRPLRAEGGDRGDLVNPYRIGPAPPPPEAIPFRAWFSFQRQLGKRVLGGVSVAEFIAGMRRLMRPPALPIPPPPRRVQG